MRRSRYRIREEQSPAAVAVAVGKGIAGSRFPPSGRSLSWGNAIVARLARFGGGALLSLGGGERVTGAAAELRFSAMRG